MEVKPISALTRAEICDLATHAAERGERIEDVNPFPEWTRNHVVFTNAFVKREAVLRPFTS
ncbi:hypothetical protein [Variovorax sp. dw_954]|uniref:hypothetical protein n=1 Tax=Variovorax sp. dw_954 TaxID=2720078 RepID=UPI001BD67967|nr:hypothetical protein [Variovorax sp. dw_954]